MMDENEATSFHSIAVDGPELLGRPVGGAELRVVQLGSGRLRGRLVRATIGEVGLSRGSFSLPLRATGVLSEKMVTMGLLLRSTVPAVGASAVPITPGDVVAVPPRQYHETTYGASASFVGLSFDPTELASYFGSHSELSEPGYWSRRRHFRAPESADPAEIDRSLNLVFARLARRERISLQLRDYLKRSVVDGFSGPILYRAEPDGSRPSASRVLKRVESFVERNAHRPIHISEICTHLRISRRSLHRCFHDLLGMGPVTFLRRKRLSSVRAMLRRLDPETASVSDVASEFGFLDLSRFARQYRSLFDEYPNETLKR